MKFISFILVFTIIISCNSQNNTSMSAKVSNIYKDDSCQLAIQFENAKMAESMIERGYSGTIRNFWGNDTTKLDFIHIFENGKLTKSVFYYDNGSIQEEYIFKCGALHGDQKFYYKSGKLSKIIPYRYGRTNGIGKLFDEEGILRQESILVSDSIISIKNYDEKGFFIKDNNLLLT